MVDTLGSKKIADRTDLNSSGDSLKEAVIDRGFILAGPRSVVVGNLLPEGGSNTETAVLIVGGLGLGDGGGAGETNALEDTSRGSGVAGGTSLYKGAVVGTR